ncbi:hypothetical protein HDV05_008247 [Chytridiales sp. JEL 0842]|nr:hypothetical protein HDV05_008247 [Chytridiales sp. JEL 0842]
MEEFVLRRKQVSPFNVYPMGLEYLIRGWKGLTTLDFGYYTDVDDSTTHLLTTHCPNLTHLSLLVVTFDSITDSTLHALTSFQKRQSSPLKSLLFHTSTRFSTSVLLQLLLVSPNLEALQLPAIVDERLLMTAVGRCKKLRWLSLEGSRALGVGGLGGAAVGVGGSVGRFNGIAGGMMSNRGNGSVEAGGRGLVGAFGTSFATPPGVGCGVTPGPNLLMWVLKNSGERLRGLKIGHVRGGSWELFKTTASADGNVEFKQEFEGLRSQLAVMGCGDRKKGGVLDLLILGKQGGSSSPPDSASGPGFRVAEETWKQYRLMQEWLGRGNRERANRVPYVGPLKWEFFKLVPT